MGVELSLRALMTSSLQKHRETGGRGDWVALATAEPREVCLSKPFSRVWSQDQQQHSTGELARNAYSQFSLQPFCIRGVPEVGSRLRGANTV